MPELQLRVVDGPAAGATISAAAEPFTIGRDEGEAGRLGDDPELSRRHAVISERDGRLVVEDLGSTNGTIVNGRRIDAPTELKAGDSLQLGTTNLAVEELPHIQATAARPVPQDVQVTAPRQVRREPPSLRVVSGPATGTAIPLAGEFTIGRSEQGAGTLGGDPELSRRHARIYEEGERILVEDLGSTNGTLVNGRVVAEPTEIHAGDELQLGSTTLRLDTGAEPVPRAPTAGGDGASLRVVAGRNTGLSIPLGSEPFVIGRGEEGDGRLGGDPELSRRHVQVSDVDGRLVIEDLGSTNGTFVNGSQASGPTVIEPGDAIWIGGTTLVATTPEQPAPEIPPAEPPAASGEAGFLSRFADVSDRHPKRILSVVVVCFLIAAVIGVGLTGALEQNEGGFEDPASESAKTDERIAEAANEVPGAQVIVLVKAGQPVDSPAVRARVERLEAIVKREKDVSRTLTFYNTKSPSFVSKDGQSTYIAAFFKNVPELKREEAAVRLLEEIEKPPEVLLGGGAIAGFQLGETVTEDLGKAEGLAFPLLFALSLFVFRGFVAALLPLFVGILTIFFTFFVLRFINELVPLSQFALNIVIGLGLGLAIDYSLFIVSRYREELAKVGKGRPPSKIYGAVPRDEEREAFVGTQSEALRRAMLTAGRTILYSAVTVAAALASLTVFPQAFLYSMGIGGAVCALVAVTVSLVALPALLAILGPRVNAGAPKRWKQAALRTASQERGGGWYRLAQGIMRRPATVAAASGLFLILLALPALGIKFTGIDGSSIPSHLTARQVDDTLSRDFGLNVAEITVLAEAPRSQEAEVRAYASRLSRLPGANRRVLEPPRPLRGGLWEITVTPVKRSLDPATIDLVKQIRAGPSPFPVQVAGETAVFVDQRSSISSRLPLAGLILCSVTLIVLFLMTGSVILPIKSLLMNVLSLGAAFGLLVLIFQEGNFEGVLGFETQGAIEISQPVLLFAVAFGLATDYAVFLLTRIKEARTAGASETDAVAIGLERTGRIVTQAAMLFCIAIGAFATSSVIFIKEVGVGTALAVIIDATIIRAFLVPSLMALLGARNWWAPGPLRRLHNKIGLSEG